MLPPNSASLIWQIPFLFTALHGSYNDSNLESKTKRLSKFWLLLAAELSPVWLLCRSVRKRLKILSEPFWVIIVLNTSAFHCLSFSELLCRWSKLGELIFLLVKTDPKDELIFLLVKQDSKAWSPSYDKKGHVPQECIASVGHMSFALITL